MEGLAAAREIDESSRKLTEGLPAHRELVEVDEISLDRTES